MSTGFIFFDLPNELLVEICTSPALGIPDIAALLRVNHFLKDLLVRPLRSEIFNRRSDKFVRKALYHAAEKGDRPEVEALLKDGVLDIMHDGRTLLNSAVRALSEDALTLLLDCGVDPNTVDDRGRTPLICATAGRHLTSIRALLLCPSLDVNRPWLFGDYSALHLAVWKRYIDVVRMLLTCPRIAVNRLAITGQAPAEYEREQKLLRTMREEGRGGVDFPDRGGWAPLHATTHENGQAMLRIFLNDERVDVNIVSREGETALRLAARHNNIRAIDMLLSHPRISLQNGTGSILHYAVFFSETPTVQFLLGSKKIDVNHPNHHRRTVLHQAVCLGRTDVIRLLVRRRDLEIGACDIARHTARDLAAPSSPGVARSLTTWEILGDERYDYLNLDLLGGLDDRAWRFYPRHGVVAGGNVNPDPEDESESESESEDEDKDAGENAHPDPEDESERQSELEDKDESKNGDKDKDEDKGEDGANE